MSCAEDGRPRCGWGLAPPPYRAYHDREWGVPARSDRRLFEMLCLEGAQAGLSWWIILRKRAAYREAFDRFDPYAVARYGERKITALLRDPRIVRNRLKIRAAVENARAFLAVREEFGTFRRYLWNFVGGRPVTNAWTELRQVPPRTTLSDAVSRDLRARGFRFVGSTIVYSYLQAVGVVNDHLVSCYRYEEIRTQAARGRGGAA